MLTILESEADCRLFAILSWEMEVNKHHIYNLSASSQVLKYFTKSDLEKVTDLHHFLTDLECRKFDLFLSFLDEKHTQTPQKMFSVKERENLSFMIAAEYNHEKKIIFLSALCTELKNENKEMLYKEIIDNLPIALFAKNADKNFEFFLWNKNSELFFGASEKDAVGKSDYDFFAKDEADFFRSKDKETIENGKKTITPLEKITIQGETRYLKTTKVPMKTHYLTPGKMGAALLGFSIDITDEVTAKAQETLLSKAIENIFLGIAICHLNGDFLISNCSFDNLRGLLKLEGKKSILDLEGEVYQNILTKSEKTKIISFLDTQKDKQCHFRIADQQKFFYFSIHMSTMMHFEEEVMMFVIQNETDRKNLEHELGTEKMKHMQHQKMAIVGEFASSIVHEINNPMAVIAGNMQLFESYSQENEGPYERQKIDYYMEKIGRMTTRITNIINGLRRFYHSHSEVLGEGKKVAMDEVVSTACEVLQFRFNKFHIQLKIQVNAEPLDQLLSQAPSDYITQALTIIMSNAIDAISEHENAFIHIIVESDDKDIMVRIVDSGEGISEDIVKDIFQPFFTTKKQGVGTGLGLNLALNLIRNSGGDLKYELFNKHTSFLLILPRLRE
jgi:PAS domain S-box-containing protein